jgi:LysM repeat protein
MKSIKMAINDDQLDLVSGGSKIPYIVKAGDTINSIATDNGCTVEQLMAWNNIKNPNMLTAGQVLKIKY